MSPIWMDEDPPEQVALHARASLNGEPVTITGHPTGPAVINGQPVIEDDPPSTRARRGFTITKLSREHGYWSARVTNGSTVIVDRKHGSWQAVYNDGAGEVRREVMPEVAEALQAKVKPVEAAERRAQNQPTIPKEDTEA